MINRSNAAKLAVFDLLITVIAVLAVAVTVAVAAPSVATAAATPRTTSATSARPWPSHGQAAYRLGAGRMRVGPHVHEAPIASVAKVMTAYLVLRADPLRPGTDGFVLHVRRRDVRDERRRAAQDQSVVAVRAGERLTERQALLALLLPSANNIAIMLARRVGGSVRGFVRRMNRTARRLGMRRTRYTDPSGFLSSTRSTAPDQLRLATAALRGRTFRRMVDRRHARIPVAGRIENTDTLLGTDGFVGVKTGSTNAAGGCFVLRSWRRIHGRRVAMTGVVLGQPGPDLISAGLRAAKRLVDQVAPRPAG
jgi:D-alanyl-D-alanine carboxypeptidase (penicillin-binding protein 5/6)